MKKYDLSKYSKSLLSNKKWLIEEDGFNRKRMLSYESIFSMSNGYMGIRGTLLEGVHHNLPTTFINGVFDKSETFMRELANLPNGLCTHFNVEKDFINIDDQEILFFKRILDMKKSLLLRSCVLKDKHERITQLETIRFLSRSNPHLVCIQIRFTPLNYNGIIELENSVDGSVLNFADAPRFKVKHTTTTNNESLFDEDGVYLKCKTRDDGLSVACGSIIEMKGLGHRAYNRFGEVASEFKDFTVEKNKTYVLNKYVSYYTENDVKEKDLKQTIQKELKAAYKTGFEKELNKHAAVYKTMWSQANIDIEGDETVDKGVRFCVYQLMSTGNERSNRVSVGAKLMSGEEYGGHAFWDDELFLLPFFSYEFPKVASNMENYRYNLLDAARLNAKKTGYKGARYPWESANEGSEQCPDWTIYPDGHAEPCFVAKYEQHVTAAVAYGVLNYVKISGDKKFLDEKGLELLIETARFWSSRLEYNKKKDRYEINEVTGPDEWHEPVNNNVYTNYLARYNLIEVEKLVSELEKKNHKKYLELTNKTKLTKIELAHWQDCIEKIYLPRKKNSNLLEQFEGYFNLKDVVIKEYDENDWPKRPKELKKISRIETQIIKQADVVMLMHLLKEEFDDKTVVDNYHYYEKRTLHGSSLSPSIYAIMGLRVNDHSKAYRYLKRAATLDLLDLQKNGREGLHAANMGGVWQTMILGFMGVEIKNNQLIVNPKMPNHWKSVKFKLNYQGRLLSFKVNKKVTCTRESGKPIIINMNNKLVKI